MEEKSKGESSSEDGMSIFNESFNVEESENENEKKDSRDAQKDENNPSENDKILKCQEIFLGKKRKVLTEEEKKERTKKIIDRYCKRNDEMLKLLEKINSNEITHKNINRMMRLLAIDLSDTKKLINKKSMLHNQKKEIFQNLLNFTFQEYQYFWFKLTNGKSKKGSAQLIKSNNISMAKQILKELQEKKIKFDNDNNNNSNNNNGEEKNEEKNNKDKDNPEVKPKKERTVKEMIQAADLRDIENKKLDEFFENESAISSDESISSSISESDDDGDIDGDDNNISNSKSSKESKKEKDKEKNKEKEKEEKIKKELNEKKEKEMKLKKEMEEKARKEKEEKARKEKEEKARKEKEEKARKEKEEKARKEKEEKEKKEKMKILMEDEDEIDIFN